MRYFAIIAIAIIEMVLASCSIKEEQVILEKPTSIKLAFEATNEGEPSTKTAVQSNGTSVWWSAHEKINIFFGDSESSRFTSTNDEPVAKAQFTGSISAITGEVDGSEANYFWGVYPYNTLNTCDGTSITATLSGEQTASAGTFADNQWMTVARSQGLALSFRAVCAGFRFSVTKSGVKSVTFRGNNNEVLAGKARIGMDSNGLPIVLENLTEVKEITLSAPNDKTLDVGTMYYMTFYPTNFTDGFTVTFNTETETATRVYSTAKNFARTQVHIGTNFDSAITYEPNFVDLGLSVKWAKCNIGASKPEYSGDYYAWGETEPYYSEGCAQDNPCSNWRLSKTGYNWASYKWCEGSGNTLSKYNNNSNYGTIDNKEQLELEDDISHIKLGGGWRIPTKSEWVELYDNCSWVWKELNGVGGYEVTSKTNDNSIFLPLTGQWFGNTYYDDNNGHYWSSSLKTDDSRCAWGRNFYSGSASPIMRYSGFAIRPVTE